jgi:hypothetical protein
VATTLSITQWDNYGWNALGTNVGLINVGDTYTVSAIDSSNWVVWLTPHNLRVTDWGNNSYWAVNGMNPISLNQTFTVASLDLNNRIVNLTG